MFSSTAAASALIDLLDHHSGWKRSAKLSQAGWDTLCGLTGLILMTYPGVLIGATAIPVWSENVSILPIHFAASGLGAGVSLLELRGHQANGALNTLGMISAAAESVIGARIELQSKPALKPLKAGRSGFITRAGGILSGPLPLLLRLLSAFSGNRARARKLRRAAAVSTLTGSFLTRLAWVQAGKISAKDPRLPLGTAEIAAPSQASLEQPSSQRQLGKTHRE